MASLNKTFLMGNLTRDPQLKYLPSQMAVADFGLAVNRKYRTASGEDREEVLFIDCVAFGKTGELINQYFTKGKPIFVEGGLKYDSWEDKQSGVKRSKIVLNVQQFQFIGSREGGEQRDDSEYDQTRQQQRPRGASRGGGNYQKPHRPPAAPAERPFGDDQQVDDSDIPF